MLRARSSLPRAPSSAALTMSGSVMALLFVVRQSSKQQVPRPCLGMAKARGHLAAGHRADRRKEKLLPCRRFCLDGSDACDEFGVAHRAFGNDAELRIGI